MRFLCDMGISRHVHETLLGAGHDSLHLRDEGLQRMADARIVEKARRENRVVLMPHRKKRGVISEGGAGVPWVAIVATD